MIVQSFEGMSLHELIDTIVELDRDELRDLRAALRAELDQLEAKHKVPRKLADGLAVAHLLRLITRAW